MEFQHKKYYLVVDDLVSQYLEVWFDASEKACMIHEGKVGYQGKVVKHPVQDETAIQEIYDAVVLRVKEQGYVELTIEQYVHVVVQYPLKSKIGNKRDLWLKDKTQEYLQSYLGWYGLGAVNGCDMGEGKLNIFCDVVDAEKGVSGIKSCLRTSRLDLTKALIACRKNGEEDFVLKYSKKMDVVFSL